MIIKYEPMFCEQKKEYNYPHIWKRNYVRGFPKFLRLNMGNWTNLHNIYIYSSNVIYVIYYTIVVMVVSSSWITIATTLYGAK